MPVYGPHSKGPVVLEPLVAPQLMIDPRKHAPQLVRIDQAQHLSHAVGTRLLLPDQSFHSARLAQLSLHGMEAALPQSKEEKDTTPDSPQGDAGSPACVLQLADSCPEIKNFLHIPAETAHHGRFPLACCFSRKNR
jgi:hypothetical protein